MPIIYITVERVLLKSSKVLTLVPLSTPSVIVVQTNMVLPRSSTVRPTRKWVVQF